MSQSKKTGKTVTKQEKQSPKKGKREKQSPKKPTQKELDRAFMDKFRNADGTFSGPGMKVDGGTR